MSYCSVAFFLVFIDCRSSTSSTSIKSNQLRKVTTSNSKCFLTCTNHLKAYRVINPPFKHLFVKYVKQCNLTNLMPSSSCPPPRPWCRCHRPPCLWAVTGPCASACPLPPSSMHYSTPKGLVARTTWSRPAGAAWPSCFGCCLGYWCSWRYCRSCCGYWWGWWWWWHPCPWPWWLGRGQFRRRVAFLNVLISLFTLLSSRA